MGTYQGGKLYGIEARVGDRGTLGIHKDDATACICLFGTNELVLLTSSLVKLVKHPRSSPVIW